MTYKDIYTKFLIEYDKADVSSSYPSLTNKEIAVLLDKAMYALIAQKVTGNNDRKVPLDMDSKGMADISPLIDVYLAKTNSVSTQSTTDTAKASLANNELLYKYVSAAKPDYILDAIIKYLDGTQENVQLLTSIIANKFKQTIHNKPWIKEPVMYMSNINGGLSIHVLIDSNINRDLIGNLYVRGVKIPDSFDGKQSTTTVFPLSDTVCEELINLAVIFACRSVSDPRLTTQIQTKSLEA